MSSGRAGAATSARREAELVRLTGALAVRVVDAGRTAVPEHAHDWPVLSLYVAGSYDNHSTLGTTHLASPSAMLYAAREAHANVIGSHGLEQIDIEFDPAWLRLGEPLGRRPVRHWIGGSVALAARRLAAIWRRASVDEAGLARATAEFLRLALPAEEVRRPAWLDAVLGRLDPRAPPSTAELARALDLHPAWLAQAYRAAMGEGIAETLRRRRVELAASLLRGTDTPAAEVAAAAGFCDQSHMIRAFRGLLGRTPSQVRAEAQARRAAPRPRLPRA